MGVVEGLPNLSLSNPIRRRNIWLDDVLVCVSDKTSSDIVHYNLDRDTETEFLLNGRQAETPTIVRSAISNIQLTKKKSYKNGNEFVKYLYTF